MCDEDDGDNWGYHREHCCKKHGCICGDPICPIVLGLAEQTNVCEVCEKEKHMELELIACQLNPTVGDLHGNTNKILDTIKSLEKGFSGIAVFPELSITGYPPNDLLLRKNFVEEQLSYMHDIVKATREKPDAKFIIGAVTLNEDGGKPLYNSALVIQNGQILKEYHKQLLPTYNIFDEKRYFEPGDQDQENNFVHQGKIFALFICEDCWFQESTERERHIYDHDPVEHYANLGPNTDCYISINASPADIMKHERRFNMFQTLAKDYGVSFLYVNQVGGMDDMLFDGYSFFINKENKVFTGSLGGFEQGEVKFIFDSGTGSRNDYIRVEKYDWQQEAYQYMYEGLTMGIRDYVNKNGFKKAIVACSGGIDSALVLALSSRTLGGNKVTAITMPSEISSEGSVTDSRNLCSRLGVKLIEHPIKDQVNAAISDFTKYFGEEPSKLTKENLQARIRGKIAMEFSNHYGALLLSTGNKSEMSVGYCTIYGDMCGGLSVIGDLYKTEVWGLSVWINSYVGNIKGNYIPTEIIEKEPSAELYPGQKDTDSLPPYPVLDSILKLFIERDYLTKDEIRACEYYIKDISLKEIERVLNMVDKAEFKRRQSPPILRIHRRSFGFGYNVPITKKYQTTYRNLLG